MFSYSRRVKSFEWRWQLKRADLGQFQIFRHGPIIIYTRLPAGGTYYSICMFLTNSERLISVSDAFSAFVYGYLSSCPRAHCTPNKSVPTLRYTRRPGPVYTGHAGRHLPSAVPWISEDRLLVNWLNPGQSFTSSICLVAPPTSTNQPIIFSLLVSSSINLSSSSTHIHQTTSHVSAAGQLIHQCVSRSSTHTGQPASHAFAVGQLIYLSMYIAPPMSTNQPIMLLLWAS